MIPIRYPDLEKKIILVTGAMRGIGKAIAENLAVQGAHIVFNYRKEPDLAHQFANHLKTLGGEATPLCFDITQFEQMKKAIDEFLKANGPISGLVNNAGINKDQLVLRLKEEDVQLILETNLKGTILLTSHLSRNFLKATNVSIVNMSSVVGLMGNASQAVYAASKAGILGFSKSYAKELASRNIRCNAICPGFIETEMTETLSEKAKELYLNQIPLGRMGNCHEVANLVCFLLSQASAYITGEVIKIDGGLYI